jgi:V/A-type H+-transporting ATPase subunit D
MKQKVVATRMELLRVRKRLDLAVRGHKLLKDKLEGLIRELTDRIEQYKELRLKVDRQWPELFQRFLLAEAESPKGAVEDAILQARPVIDVETKVQRIMGVLALETRAEVTAPGGAYSLMQTSPQLDKALGELREFLPDLIRLAGLEQAVRALSEEINKTRRRANALEYVLIPDLRQARRTIMGRLEEISRSETSRLMKVKQMLVERAEAEAA